MEVVRVIRQTVGVATHIHLLPESKAIARVEADAEGRPKLILPKLLTVWALKALKSGLGDRWKLTDIG